MPDEQWDTGLALTLLFPESPGSRPDENRHERQGLLAVAILLNAEAESRGFTLPSVEQAGSWNIVFHNSDTAPLQIDPASWELASRSIVCVLYEAESL